MKAKTKDVDISLKLSVVKLLHAKWLIEMYSHMTSSEGRDVCLKGQKVASILDATEKGFDGLKYFDLFCDIDPLATSDSWRKLMVTSPRQNEIYISLLSLMTMKSRNTKMKMETFLMYLMKKVMMNKFKL